MNTFIKSVRALRDAMPDHKLEVTTIGSFNYVTAKPLQALVRAIELMEGERVNMSYVPSLNIFISQVKGNSKKSYK